MKYEERFQFNTDSVSFTFTRSATHEVNSKTGMTIPVLRTDPEISGLESRVQTSYENATAVCTSLHNLKWKEPKVIIKWKETTVMVKLKNKK